MTNVFVRRFDGMDGSHWQPDAGPVDWATLKAASAGSWISWKATQSISYVDPTFATFRTQTEAQGFKYRFIYHWLSSTTDPAVQAAHFLRTIGTLKTGEGTMLDAEENGITVEKCLVVLEAVEAITKRPMSVYTGIYVAGGTIYRDSRIRTGKYGDRPIHLAAYITPADLDKRLKALGIQNLAVHAWQYSSNGPVPGIVGRCDMNSIMDFSIMNRATGQTDAPTPPSPAPPVHTSTLDDVSIITNEKVYNYQGQDYGPLVVKWAIKQDLSKQHLTEVQYKALGGRAESDVPMSNDDINSIPDYAPSSGGGTSPTTGKLVLSITGTGTGDITLS